MKLSSFLYRVMYHTSPLFSDKLYLKLQFRHLLGYKLNLDNPRTFNEKLAWLKINDRNPLYTRLADKYQVKQYVAEMIGEEYVVPCYGVWSRFEDIDWNKIPDQFVLKATHDSSGATICKNKNDLNKESIRKKFDATIKRNYYWSEREWVYKNIKPRIIADKLLDDHVSKKLLDYKFLCFDGKPVYMYCTVKDEEIFENYYDMNFNPIDINHGFPRKKPEFDKPENFEQMILFAAKLSQGMPFVRVDFFNVEGHIYFGEFTFYDWGGCRRFAQEHQDFELGKLIKLRSKTS